MAVATVIDDKEERDRILGVLTEWQEQPGNASNFVDDIVHQIMDKDFLTVNQVEALGQFVPDVEE